MSLKIKTNNAWREFVSRDEVPAKVLASQFDWTNEAHEEHGDYSHGFFKYRNYWYHLADFLRIEKGGQFSEWTGYHSDSAFSGVLIRLSDDGETFQVAWYTS